VGYPLVTQITSVHSFAGFLALTQGLPIKEKVGR
jgi:hypothetical protein